MHKYISCSLIIVQHGRNNSLEIGRSFRCVSKIITPNTSHCRVISSQLECSIIRAIVHMMAHRLTMIFRDQSFKQIFMVPFDQDDLVFFHQLKYKFLHLARFGTTVKQIAEDDKFVWLFILEKT